MNGHKSHITELGDVAQVITGVAARAAQAPGGSRRCQLLTVRALSETGIETSGMVELDVLGRIADDQRLQPGDVLLPARSTRVIAAVVPPALAAIAINATLVIVRCGPLLSPHVLAAYLNHPEGQLAIASVAQSGTAQINLTAAALRRLPVPVPPREHQERLAELLIAADEAYTTAIAAAQLRRQVTTGMVVMSLLAGTNRPRPSFSSPCSRSAAGPGSRTTTMDDDENENTRDSREHENRG